jgi:hypothetical protein
MVVFWLRPASSTRADRLIAIAELIANIVGHMLAHMVVGFF